MNYTFKVGDTVRISKNAKGYFVFLNHLADYIECDVPPSNRNMKIELGKRGTVIERAYQTDNGCVPHNSYRILSSKSQVTWWWPELALQEVKK